MEINWDQYKVTIPQPSEQSSAKVDWEQYRSPNKSNLNQQNESSWNVAENLGRRFATTGAPNMAKDVWNKAKEVPGAIVSGIGNIPTGIDYLKENIPAAGRLIGNEPAVAGKEALAGAGELAGQISRIPSGLVNYLAKIGMIKPETASQFAQPLSEEQVKGVMDKFVGEEKPGGELIRGVVRNAPSLYGAGKLVTTFNPLKLTNKAIAKDIVKTESKMKNKYSGKEGAYEKLFQEADARGVGQTNYNPAKIDIGTIKKYTADPKSYEAVEEFLASPSLATGQKAVSDLGYLERKLKNKSTLNSVERKQLNAVREAKSHIQENMFKDAQGNLHPDLLMKHGLIQKGYKKEVIPYTKNKAIQAYKENELLAKELIPKLSKGKFAAQRGGYHPALARRETADKILKGAGLVGGLGTAVSAGNWMINKLLGNNS